MFPRCPRPEPPECQRRAHVTWPQVALHQQLVLLLVPAADHDVVFGRDEPQELFEPGRHREEGNNFITRVEEGTEDEGVRGRGEGRGEGERRGGGFQSEKADTCQNNHRPAHHYQSDKRRFLNSDAFSCEGTGFETPAGLATQRPVSRRRSCNRHKTERYSNVTFRATSGSVKIITTTHAPPPPPSPPSYPFHPSPGTPPERTAQQHSPVSLSGFAYACCRRDFF